MLNDLLVLAGVGFEEEITTDRERLRCLLNTFLINCNPLSLAKSAIDGS